MGRLTTTRRVSRHAPCPICGHPDWCRVALNGAYAVCNRITSERAALGNGGGWVHRLADNWRCGSAWGQSLPTPLANARLAGLDRRNRVYRHLLARTPLSDAHRQKLANRGYSDGEITLRGYGSLPAGGRAKIVREILPAEPVEGVPGFWLTANERGSYWTLAGSPGLLIPVKTPDKRIRAMRIRPDDPGPSGKYHWLSSADRPQGTGSEASCHVARPVLRRVEDEAVWITEGEIKADLSSERLSAVVLSIPGVSLWTRALDDLPILLPHRGRVVVALDADWQKNQQVHEALWGLLRASEILGHHVEVALWEVSKGLDDLLVAGRRPEIHPATVIPAPPWRTKVSSRILCDLTTTDSAAAALPLPEIRRRLAAAFAGDDHCRSSA